MRKVLVSALCLSVLLLSASSCLASDTAKSLGLGGAMVAIADDMSAPFVNPAGLVNVKKQTIGLSASSGKSIWWAPGDSLNSEDSDVWENAGLIMPLGSGAFFVGSGITRNFFVEGMMALSSVGQFDYRYKVYAPSISYAMRVWPELAIGATASYFVANSNWLFDIAAPVNMWSNGSGVGATFGALYSPGPLIDLGMSFGINSNITTYGKLEDPPGSDFVQEVFPNPSELRLGASIRPMPGLIVSGQFDIRDRICGFYTNQSPDNWADWAEIHADSVVVSRIGAEYQVQTGYGYIPVRAGMFTVPDCANKVDFPGGMPDLIFIAPIFQYLGNEMTGMSIGTGFVGEQFEVGVSVSSSRGIVKEGVPSERFIVEDSKAVVSACVKL